MYKKLVLYKLMKGSSENSVIENKNLIWNDLIFLIKTSFSMKSMVEEKDTVREQSNLM